MRALVAALALLAGPAAAAVPVRSGDHATFARLVYRDPSASELRVSSVEGGIVELRLGEGAPDLDLGAIFDRIPRERITEASFAGGVLRLTLGCVCDVRVERISSGHVVIDVEDPLADPSAGAAQNIVQPMALVPRPVTLTSTDGDPGPSARRDGPTLARSRALPQPVPPAPPTPRGPAQVRIHPSASLRLLPAPDPMAVTPHVPTCAIEGRAAEIIEADPEIALAELPAAFGAILDGGEEPSDSGALALAETYLRVGWGAEASRVLSDSGIVDRDLDAIGAALDGVSSSTALDPGCGPATTFLALLSPDPMTGWDRADHAALVLLMDALPKARWRDARAAVAERLTELGAADLLAVRRDAPRTDPSSGPPREAGTDLAAVLAVTETLDAAAAEKRTLGEIDLVNADALLASVPEGVAHDRLAAALVDAQLRAGFLASAAAATRGDPALAESLLDTALQVLPSGRAAEFAVRIRPELPPGGPAALRAAALLRGYGLNDVAALFDRRPVSETALPRDVTGSALADRPWLARDFAAMSASGEEGAPRRDVANAIVLRNAAQRPDGDLAVAEQALEQSRRIGDALARLLQEPER